MNAFLRSETNTTFETSSSAWETFAFPLFKEKIVLVDRKRSSSSFLDREPSASTVLHAKSRPSTALTMFWVEKLDEARSAKFSLLELYPEVSFLDDSSRVEKCSIGLFRGACRRENCFVQRFEVNFSERSVVSFGSSRNPHDRFVWTRPEIYRSNIRLANRSSQRKSVSRNGTRYDESRAIDQTITSLRQSSSQKRLETNDSHCFLSPPSEHRKTQDASLFSWTKFFSFRN